jgi:predicted RNA-binding Zn ribbon-like protein
LFPVDGDAAIAPSGRESECAAAALAMGRHTVLACVLPVVLCARLDPPQEHRTAAIPRGLDRSMPLPPSTITLVTPNLNPRSAGKPSLRSVAAQGGRQPGDREPAPDELRLLQEFVNSFWDIDRGQPEQWSTPASFREWLTQRRLVESDTAITEVDLVRALDVRGGLRALLLANNGAPLDREAVDGLNRALEGPGLFVQLSATRPPDFAAQHRDLDGMLAMVATIAAVAQLDGRWQRLKACRGEHCGWAFYDHSRNQGSNWCAMSVCGSRAKARAYRRRRLRSAAS